MKRTIGRLLALTLLVCLLCACSREQDSFNLFQKESSEPAADVQEEGSAIQEQESVTEAEDTEEKPAEEKEENKEEKTEPYSIFEPEPKLLYKIEENGKGEISEWTNYYYDGDILSYTENPLTDTIVNYDEKGRELTTERPGYGVIKEYRYDDWDNLVYFQAADVTEVTLKDHDGNEVCKFRHTVEMAAEYEYDDRGRVTFSRIVSDDQDVTFSYEYAEDGMGLNVIRHADGEDTLYREFRYDGHGHIVYDVDHSIGDDIINTWQYDDKGYLVFHERNLWGDVTQDTYERDDDGKILTHTTNYPSGAVDHSTNNWSEDGKLLSWESERNEPSWTVPEVTYVTNEYNDRGDHTRSYRYFSDEDSDMELERTTYYIYDYDHIDPNKGDDYH